MPHISEDKNTISAEMRLSDNRCTCLQAARVAAGGGRALMRPDGCKGWMARVGHVYVREIK